MKVDTKQYPYEMFCLACDFAPAYLDHDPGDGRISSKGAILIDGTPPIPGSEVVCNCPPGTAKAFGVRERKEIVETLSKCCNARMVAGGIQCEICGSNGE